MKLSKFASLLMIGLALTFIASGCKKKPGAVTPLPAGQTRNPSDMAGNKLPGDTGTPDSKIPEGGMPITDPKEFENWSRDADIFKSDIIFFAYDSSVVRSGEKSKASKVADYFKGNPGHAIEIDGHCDERGTEEYNRSLGDRRALSVREELARLGVDSAKIITKSFGKDRPIEPLHSEAAWSKNRRAEFILLSPPK